MDKLTNKKLNIILLMLVRILKHRLHMFNRVSHAENVSGQTFFSAAMFPEVHKQGNIDKKPVSAPVFPSLPREWNKVAYQVDDLGYSLVYHPH